MGDLGNVDHLEMGKWVNNRVENSLLPIRRRMRHAQISKNEEAIKVQLGPCSGPHPVSQECHLIGHEEYKRRCSAAFTQWQNLMA